MKVAVIGSSGIVGREIISLLEKRRFPLKHLLCYASKASLGSFITFRGEKILFEEIQSFHGIDLAFFAVNNEIAKELYPLAKKAGTFVIDSSSAFRMEAPLVLPEINGEEITDKSSLISSPNCVASLIALPLYPIHMRFKIKRIVATALQSASGGGKELLRKLQDDTSLALQGIASTDHRFFGFNIFSHNTPLHSSGYVQEEVKIIQELQKIFQAPQMGVSVSSIRVPVKRAHSISVNVECEEPFLLSEIYDLLEKTSGVIVYEDKENNRFPTPLDASGKDEVFCGKIRKDLSQAHTFEMLIVGDQLLKGAALNAVQIAEVFAKKVEARQTPSFSS